MMDSRFDYKSIEDRWRRKWAEEGYIAQPNKTPFTMVIPPPNVTGKLHMGHALNNTLIDIYIRTERLKGKDSMLIPGTDHAGIATQTKVEKHLLSQGIKKEDIGKDKFIEQIYKWKDEHGCIIIDQLKQMGCLYDWENEHFTMDAGFSKLVTDMFIKLYNDGLIYRSNYINNWCPKHQTALANDEIVHNETTSNMYYIKYKTLDKNDNDMGFVTIATTRPETLLGDTAIAYNPDDSRYAHLTDYYAIVPFVNRKIRFIPDAHVKSDMGSGLVKITPAHDFNDYDMGKRHNLEFIQILDKNAHMINTGTEFDGMYKLKARTAIVEKLKKLEQLNKIVKIKNTHSVCYRCDEIIEPMISPQWFVRMKPLAEKAQEAVDNDRVKFYPEYHTKIFNNWMGGIKDWCISRQIWWGHKIPIWYHNDDGSILCQRDSPGENYTQDPDVLDTWFSSWLWPTGVIKKEEFSRRNPTDLLITGSDILFFWVSRMIMASLYLHDDVPFKAVYLHGIVRAPDGTKMSKSLGNVIDPIDIINNYGTDAMRFMLAMFTPNGKDIEYSPGNLKISRNFLTKLWNTVRFYKMTFESYHMAEIIDYGSLTSADSWIISKFAELVNTCNVYMEKYDIASYASAIYGFLFNMFCCDYLEYCKDMKISENSHRVFRKILDGLLIILHPITPFITEELRYMLCGNDTSILASMWPTYDYFETEFEKYKDKVQDFEATLKTISEIRHLENSKGTVNKSIIVNTETLKYRENSEYVKLKLSSTQVSI